MDGYAGGGGYLGGGRGAGGGTSEDVFSYLLEIASGKELCLSVPA